MDENMEEVLKSVADFLSVDNYVRGDVFGNIQSLGEDGLYEIAGVLSRKYNNKYGLSYSSRDIASMLAKVYEYGMIRFEGEYDNRSIDERDLLNREGLVDEVGVSKVMDRKMFVTFMVGSLEPVVDSFGRKCPPSYWGDFVNRGYDVIRDRIKNDYGSSASDHFEYHEYYDLRDELRMGINSIMTKVYNKSGEGLIYLNQSSMKLDEKVSNLEKNNSNNLASLFDESFTLPPSTL